MGLFVFPLARGKKKDEEEEEKDAAAEVATKIRGMKTTNCRKASGTKTVIPPKKEDVAEDFVVMRNSFDALSTAQHTFL